MLSQQNYQRAAEAARTAGAAATGAAEAEACGQAWAAFTTAANHALLVQRWRRTLAAERQAAARPPVVDPWTMRFSPRRSPPPVGDLEARAEEAARILAAHEKAAEDWGNQGYSFAAAAQQARQAPSHTPRGGGAPPMPPRAPRSPR